ncbi:MAG: chromosomal replication initiator protein DnaA [Parcubacteria group bacterium SW_4_49_11]|nr:MAG: chromosomal replication initiator protein DnaA [Parcubacteria group bacterium SW_4_49_11]
MDERQRIWNAVLGEIELNVSKAQFDTWIKDTYIVRMDKNEIIVCVPNTFTREWLSNKFHSLIVESVQNITGEIKTVSYEIEDRTVSRTKANHIVDLKSSVGRMSSNNEETEDADSADGEPESPFTDSQAQQSAEATQHQDSLFQAPTSSLNGAYTFENFIVGGSNELAHAAALNVAKEPGTRYNPLFVYGGVGLGKTHLIQAIGNQLSAQDYHICYVSSDTFISEFTKSVRQGNINQFKEKYRAADVLIIDDVQFIGGKEKTQEEVFNTFNELYSHNKQIILTSDRPPNAIQTLNDRLKSRFEGGMIADIVLPEFETRVAILKSKCEQKQFELPEAYLYPIAEHIKSNVRELEGALNQVIAQAQLLGNSVTEDMIKRIVAGSTTEKTRSLDGNTLIEVIVDHFRINKDDLFSKTRRQEIAYPRQLTMYLLREELEYTYPGIGKSLGGRDHTTVMHAHQKIKERLSKDYALEQDVTILRNKLYNS